MTKQETHWFFKPRGEKAKSEKRERLTQQRERAANRARDSHTRYKESRASQQPESKQPTAEKAIKQSDKQPMKKES